MKYFLMLILTVASTPAAAFSDFAGDGYFSCTSCHVSTSGGDMLTQYGRSFAEEKLAADSYEGEAMPMHKNGLTPDWLLLGGHSRWIQIHHEDAGMKVGRFFNMQRSLDVGFQKNGFYSYIVLTQKRAETYDYDKNTIIIDRFLTRYDITDFLSVRYGYVSPKFGLNLSDHNAWVRAKAGLGVGSEEGIGEASWFSETAEINISHSAPVPENLAYFPSGKSGKLRNTYLNVSTFILEKNRVSLSGLHRKSGQEEQSGASLSAALAPGTTFRYTTEANSIHKKTAKETSDTHSLYAQLTLWTMRGVYPGIRYEQTTESSDLRLTRSDKITLNASLHPRPHFELSAALSLFRDLEAFSFGHTGFVMFHYWL